MIGRALIYVKFPLEGKRNRKTESSRKKSPSSYGEVVCRRFKILASRVDIRRDHLFLSDAMVMAVVGPGDGLAVAPDFFVKTLSNIR